MSERWLVFHDDGCDGLSFDGEYASIEAVEAEHNDSLSGDGIVAYGVIDDQPLIVQRLIKHLSDLPDKNMNGRRIQIAWVDVDDSRKVIKIVKDYIELIYEVAPPPGYHIMLDTNGTYTLELSKGQATWSSGLWKTERIVDPL